ncbi:MAG TPA: hypothetical protein DCO79_00285 [Spirochaeta sp.]|nr:hypothetical protein [Spirochaeta sp.]
MKKALLFFILILSLFTPFWAFSDNIRGDVVKHVMLSDQQSGSGQEFSLNIENVFAVSIDKDSEFIAGFEIEIKVPSSLRTYSNSFAFNIYNKISPAVSTGIGTYYGRKYHSLILPEAARFFIRLPYEAPLDSETEPYTTVLSDVLVYNDSPLMVTVLPMMKGFPSSLYSSSFSIRVSPILKDSGNLNLSVDVPEGLNMDELTIEIDGINHTETKGIRLASGSHSLSIEIPGGRGVSRNFTIRKGETTELKLAIEELESWASIDVPENTQIYIDGEKIELEASGRILMTPGEHTVLFKIDNYKISKKFDIQPGKDCKISLFLDIFIEEN